MNVTHLKYAVEVSKTGSISKAAENLFIGQPNVSKGIKELEEEFGFTIFNRTAKGVIPTEKGAEFLDHAKRIIAEIAEFEELYRAPKGKQTFKISVPRCYYAVGAISEFASKLDPEMGVVICVSETGAMEAISNLLTENYNLAIIRIKDEHEPNFMQFIKEKDLKSELISTFKYRALISKNHRYAKESKVTREDLADNVEILWGFDPVPFLTAPKEINPGKQIRISGWHSEYELLSAIPDSFMWESPTDADILDRYGLVQRDVADADGGRYLLVYPKSHRLTKLDNMYLGEFKRAVGR